MSATSFLLSRSRDSWSEEHAMVSNIQCCVAASIACLFLESRLTTKTRRVKTVGTSLPCAGRSSLGISSWSRGITLRLCSAFSKGRGPGQRGRILPSRTKGKFLKLPLFVSLLDPAAPANACSAGGRSGDAPEVSGRSQSSGRSLRRLSDYR